MRLGDGRGRGEVLNRYLIPLASPWSVMELVAVVVMDGDAAGLGM